MSAPNALSSTPVPEMPIVAPPSEAEQIAQLFDRLRRIDGVDMRQARVVRAPLRISPLGAHIDHQLGIVTGMTIDRAILLAFVPSADGQVRMESLNFAAPASFELANIPPMTKGDWANYVRGAALALQQRHDLRLGLTGVVGGSMPIGGLSSSAAVTIAYLLALEAIHDLAVDAYENVELCRFSENRYIGLNNGILDQSVILHSAQQHLTRIDCQTVAVDRVPVGLDAASLRDQFEILVVYSGLSQGLVGTDYNNRVAQCRSAAEQMLAQAGLPVPPDVRLRHVPDQVYARHGAHLDAPLQRRARHFFGEMDRVRAGVEAWQAGDLVRFGELVTASGESSIRWYESGSPQLITLFEILAQTPGVYGTRFSGAGFRGNCIALIDPAYRETIAAAVHAVYPKAHPEEAARYSIHFCRPDGQAGLIPAVAVSGVTFG
jgi:galactokinase/galacturonokinase